MRIVTYVQCAGAVVAFIGLWPAISNGQTTSSSPPAPPQQTEDHAAHEQGPTKPAHPALPTPQEDHSKHQTPPSPPLPPFIPPVTDQDRKAAFPDVMGHAVHDNAVNSYVLFDQLEWQKGDDAGLSWDGKGWVGRDRDRIWFRSEGERNDDRVTHAEGHVLYGRAIARWWDVVLGVRQDVRPGRPQRWAAVGIQGLAPYWFEVEATAYIGAEGRTHVRVETEYELLLTNRLILQPLVEVQIYGKSDPERGLGSGLSSADAGLRVRYEFRRELAPYVGVTWNRKFFGTADFARAAGNSIGDARFALGLRFWF